MLSPHVRWRRPKTSQLFKISCHLYSQLIYLGSPHLFGAPPTSRLRVTLELKRTFLKNTCSHDVRGRKRSNPGNELQLPVHQNLGIWFGRSLFQNFHVGHTAEIRVRDSKDLSQRSGLKAIQLSKECFVQPSCVQTVQQLGTNARIEYANLPTRSNASMLPNSVESLKISSGRAQLAIELWSNVPSIV